MNIAARPSLSIVTLGIVGALVAAPHVAHAATEWLPLGPPGATVTALARSASEPQTVYAGLVDAGVFRSDDGGRHWRAARGGLFATAVDALAVDPGTATTVFAATSRGVYRSDDGGVSWTDRSTGLPNAADGGPAAVLALAVDPIMPETLYAGTGLGVSKSTDGARTWSPAGSGLPGSVRALAVDPTATQTLYAGTANGPYRSDDGGASWMPLAGNAGPGLDLGAQVLDLAVSSAAPQTLVVALDVRASAAVVRSDDRGASWSAADDGLPRGSSDRRSAGAWRLRRTRRRPSSPPASEASSAATTPPCTGHRCTRRSPGLVVRRWSSSCRAMRCSSGSRTSSSPSGTACCAARTAAPPGKPCAPGCRASA